MEKSKTIIKFSAYWCGPCKKIAPLFHKLSEEYKDIEFKDIDIEKDDELANKYNIQALPTFLFLENGHEHDRLCGANEVELNKKVKTFNNQ
jgi:thioredoxin 1